MRAVSSGTSGTGCGRGSDMDDLWTRKPSNAMAHHKAADFANGVLSVVFLDTTSLSFTGAGGESLGERGYSKDHRPDLMQMIVGVVIDAEGRPVCSEMWPGNTADVSVLVPVIDRLRSRFSIGRVCVVADRGMVSAPT